jgi:hypothetical protein
MSFLKRDEVLKAQDLQYEDVDVPEWGGTVRIAGLSAEAASAFSDKMVELDNQGKIKAVRTGGNFMAELLVVTVVDEEFNLLFSSDDIASLGRKSAAVVKRLSEVALRLSGLGEHAVEDAEKN